MKHKKIDFRIEINNFEISCIILAMQKLDSEKLHKGNNGMYLDFYDRKILHKLVKIQKERRLEIALRMFQVKK